MERCFVSQVSGSSPSISTLVGVSRGEFREFRERRHLNHPADLWSFRDLGHRDLVDAFFAGCFIKMHGLIFVRYLVVDNTFII
jgi:hypothetical protein